MSIESEPGQGTTVRIYLPYDDSNSVKAEPIKTQVEIPRGSDEIVLVVEDNSVVGRVLIRTLAGLGYQTLEVTNVSDAEKLLEARDDIALIMTDVVLPGGKSGLDLVAKMGTLDHPPEILIMSGYPLPENDLLSDVLSKHSLIKKPFDREVLAQIIGEKLGAVNAFHSKKKSIVNFPCAV